ncbi:MAG: helix-turn-helix transcriptional regulator [Sulfurimonas sp.]
MKENTSITDEKVLQIYKIIGDNVKRIRKEKNVSQMQLALAIGHKAVGTISMAELCINNKHFNIEHLVKIADVLEVELADFFYGINLK